MDPISGQHAVALTITGVYNRLLQPALATAHAHAPPAPTPLPAALARVDGAIDRARRKQDIAA